VREVLADVQTHQVIADDLPAGHAAALLIGEFPGPAHDLGSHPNGIRLAIDGFPGKYIPNGDEQFAGDDNNRLGIGHAAGIAIELSLPVGEVPHGAPGGFDQGPTQFTAAGFGDFTGAMGLAAVMDGGSQAGISDELIGGRETGNIADGGQDGHGQEDAETRKLDEEGDEIGPRSLSGKVGDLGFQLNDLSRKMIQGGEILADTELLGGGNGKGLPLGKVGEGEGIAVRSGEVVAEKGGMKAVGDHGAVANQSAPMGEKDAGIADEDRRNPDLWDEIGGKQSSQGHGIDLIGFDPAGRDKLDKAGIGDDDLGDERSDLVVEIPGIGSGFNDEDIGGKEMGFGPSPPTGELEASGREDGGELGTYAADDDVVLMEVGGEETGGGWRKRGI
jgi:hypothetical protein